MSGRDKQDAQQQLQINRDSESAGTGEKNVTGMDFMKSKQLDEQSHKEKQTTSKFVIKTASNKNTIEGQSSRKREDEMSKMGIT